MTLQPLEVWRILLVDDDNDDYVIFKDLLNQAQGRCVSLEWAPSYQAAAQMLNDHIYDAVFVDYYLGTESGIRLIRETVERGYPAPMILLTGQGSREADLDAMDAGATFYLTKDEINPLSLERFIRYAIERRRTEEALRVQTLHAEFHHRLLAEREQERQSIARELHDGPIQELLTILLNIHYRQDTTTDTEMVKELDQIETGLNLAIQNLRDLINQIRPPFLLRFGLSKAIQNYMEEFQCQHPEIELCMALMDNDEDCLSEQARLGLFRILQETLANTVKHANTKRIEVTWTCEGQQAVLQVRDEGKGFLVLDNLFDYSTRGHYGLVGMKERAEATGGTFSITSEPGKGTTVLAVVPV